MSKNIFITGATSGFGMAAARLFAENGNNLIILVEEKIGLKSFPMSFKTNLTSLLLLYVLMLEIVTLLPLQ